MKLRDIVTIENKIKELENRIEPLDRYDINNQKMKYSVNGAVYDAIVNAKINALKWCLFKKIVL